MSIIVSSPLHNISVEDDGEPPFNEFSYSTDGGMDIRVFEQDVWWVNRDGKPYRLELMSKAYLKNVLNHVHDYTDFYHQRFSTKIVERRIKNPSAELVRKYASDRSSIERNPPRMWLDDTPLVKKIVELLKEKGK